jgi:hypothetical protein
MMEVQTARAGARDASRRWSGLTQAAEGRLACCELGGRGSKKGSPVECFGGVVRVVDVGAEFKRMTVVS